MAQNASDSQKVDYLWKKIVYGAAKTDISGNIDATNEPNPSPLQIRSDKILTNSDQIPGVIPSSNSSVVTVYPTTFPVECISTAGIPTPTLTWQTGRTFWVPPEFGSTYQIKVYIAPSGNAANVASKGTQVFATGSGNNDLWVFDYQSGILNFNSNNTPYNGASPISFTGNSVYISGAVYAGTFGLGALATQTGNITFANTTATSTGNITLVSASGSNIYLNAQGTGITQIVGNDALGIPSGNTATRPANPQVGYMRINTDLAVLEYYTGSGWVNDAPALMTSQVITPDGTSNVYSLSSNAITTGVFVSINGTLQQPYTAYNIVNNNQISFTEIPLTSDSIEIRTVAAGITGVQSLILGQTSITIDPTNTIKITNNGTEYIDIGSTGAIIGVAPNSYVASTSIRTLDSYDKTIYRTAKYIIQATSNTDSESYESLVTHNGASTAYITTYGNINTGTVLGNISANITGNMVNLNYTAFTSSANVRITKNYIIL